jgi:hypothetical protein
MKIEGKVWNAPKMLLRNRKCTFDKVEIKAEMRKNITLLCLHSDEKKYLINQFHPANGI